VLMRHSRNCQTSGARDKVYAFLGLTDPTYGIVPDYAPSNSIVDVLTHTARRIIGVEKSLEILSDAIKLRSADIGTQLPSWVPDWTRPEDSESRRFRHTLQLQPDCKASLNMRPKFAFEADIGGKASYVLQVSGIFVGNIVRNTRDEYKSWCEFRTDGNYLIRTTSSADIGDELWVIYGVDFPFVLRRKDNDYLLLGEAMIWSNLERDQQSYRRQTGIKNERKSGRSVTVSNILYGDMINRVANGTARKRPLRII
jgi:hypothetical protein